MGNNTNIVPSLVGYMSHIMKLMILEKDRVSIYTTALISNLSKQRHIKWHLHCSRLCLRTVFVYYKQHYSMLFLVIKSVVPVTCVLVTS